MAEDFLDNEEVRAEQLDKLSEGDINAGQLKDVDDISDKLRHQMDDAGKVFNNDDRDRWERRIASAKSNVNLKELEEIQKGIADERDRINKITPEYLKRIDQNAKYFTKDADRKIDTAQEIKDRFVHATVAERDKMFAAWEPSMENRKRIYTELAKHLGSEAEVGKMRHRERSAQLDEIEKNLAPHKKLEADYALYPAKYRAMVPDFKRRNVEGKQEGIKTMNEALDAEFAKALKDGKGSMTAEEQKEARDYFSTAPLTGAFSKFKALEMLKSHINEGKEVVGEFDEEAKDWPSDSFVRSVPALGLKAMADIKKEFGAARFEGKKELIAQMKKAREEAEGKLDDMYEATLNYHEDNIGPVTYKSFLTWFKQRGLKDKAHAYEQAENPNNPDGLIPRVKVGQKFQKEVSPTIKSDPKYAAIVNEFRTTAGGGRRQEILNQLLEVQKQKGIVVKPEDAEKNQKAETEAEGENTVQKPVSESATIEQLQSNAEDKEFLEGMTDEQLQAIIKMGMQAESVRKQRELATIYQEAADSMAKTEKTSGAIKQSARRSEAEKANADIEDELAEHTAKEGRAQQILNKDGEAEDVIEIDDEKLKQKDAIAVHNMTHDFADLQRTEQAQRDASRRIRVINTSKQETSSDMLADRAEDMKDETDNVIALSAARKLGGMGKKIGKKDLTRLEDLAKEADTRIKFEKKAA